MDTTQIKFTPGSPFLFIATRKFALGATGVDVLEGMEVHFDGSVAEVNGVRYQVPQLRGTLRLGWLVLADEYDSEAPEEPRMSANIQVRAAVNMSQQNSMAPPQRSPITTAEADERIVMTNNQRTAAMTQATVTARQQHTQRQAGGGVARSFNGTGGEVDVGGSDFGVPVGRSFLTPAKERTSVTRDSVGQAIMAADRVKVQPGQGLSEEQMLGSMTEDQRAAYLTAKETARANVTSRVNPNYTGPVGPQVGTPAPPRAVGRVKTARTQTADGITSTVTTGGGTEIYDPSGSDGKATQTSIEVEGMRFSNTNGPKRTFQATPSPSPQEDQLVSKIEKDGTADQRRKIAKAICADFPSDYNFSDHWKRRLAMIRLNYEGRADVIRAVFAAESDDFKKVLMEEFPEVFSS